jgi:threonine dehydrogenase-like Zn-dependent dehydrogenase
VRVETVPDPTIQEPTDAIVRIVAGCICGSDLWPYASKPESAKGSRMGHEFVGIVEELGSQVTGLSIGDFVIAPFVASDGTCDFCKEVLQTSCRHGAHWGGHGDGGQGVFARVPQAAGTRVVVPAGFDEKLIPSPPARSMTPSPGGCKPGSMSKNNASPASKSSTDVLPNNRPPRSPDRKKERHG